MNPRNVGEIESGRIRQGGKSGLRRSHGDIHQGKEDRVEDIKFRTFGCASAIAVSSMVTEMAKGMSLEEAMKITG